MNLTVRLDKENQRFYTTVEGIEHEVRYKILTPKLYEYSCSDQESASDAQTVEEELLYSAFLFAQKEGIKVVPVSENVVNYLNKHKEFTCVTVQETQPDF